MTREEYINNIRDYDKLIKVVWQETETLEVVLNHFKTTVPDNGRDVMLVSVYLTVFHGEQFDCNEIVCAAWFDKQNYSWYTRSPGDFHALDLDDEILIDSLRWCEMIELTTGL